MFLLIFIIGLIVGLILNFVIESISYKLSKSKNNTINILIPIIYALVLEILFLRFGVTILLAKALILTALLIITSFIDIKHRVIPNFMVIITLVVGIIFSFLVKASPLDTLLGMMTGGGILFLLALIPNVMGGGDIKLMFSLGAFLGIKGAIWTLILAFIASSIISIILILFKIKGTKDYIPFGPFLAIGSIISLLVFV